MVLSVPVKALAFILFVAAIAAATYGVQTIVGDTVESQVLAVDTPRALINGTGGHTVTYVVTLHNRDSAARDARVLVEGIATGASDVTTVRGNTTVGLFVPVNIPENAPAGQHALTVRVESDGQIVRTRESLLTLQVLEPGVGFEMGDAADALYVGRLTATGRVFNTNDQALVGVAIPRTDSYRFSPGLLPVQTHPRPTIVAGLVEGMIGMQAGETRTVSFPPEKGYGPATEEQVETRDEIVVRTLAILNDAQRVPRETFDTYVEESGQGSASTFEVGSIFTLNQNNNDWPYRIIERTDQIVEYKLAAQAGEAYTVYPFWPNASIIQSINDSHVVFRTTPTTDVGQVFTMKAHWPEMTSVREVNQSAVIVRHSPPVGYSYTSVSQLGQPRDATVKSVNETHIVTAIPSANPLAGKDLTFDVTLMAITKRG